MSGRISTHLRLNVVGYIAVFIALGGVSYAAGLARDSVKSKQIKEGAVKGPEVADGALSGADIADGTISGTDVADDSLTGADVQESSLDLPDPAQPDTPQQLLEKLLTVDGPGSTLTADALDGLDSSNLYTKTEVDDRYPLADASFSMVAASATGTYVPFATWAELDLACDAGGVPSISLQNVSGSNLRVYTDDGGSSPTASGPLANTASTAATAGTTGDGTADHVTYLSRGPLGTVRYEAWIEELNASTNCLFNVQAVGQAIGLTPSS